MSAVGQHQVCPRRQPFFHQQANQLIEKYFCYRVGYLCVAKKIVSVMNADGTGLWLCRQSSVHCTCVSTSNYPSFTHHFHYTRWSVTAILKRLCLISVENFPAVVDLNYSKLEYNPVAFLILFKDLFPVCCLNRNIWDIIGCCSKFASRHTVNIRHQLWWKTCNMTAWWSKKHMIFKFSKRNTC
jgi:hypothetical protein